MGRHEQREQVFKLLFRVEFYDAADLPEQETLFFEDDEVKASEKDTAYIREKYGKVRALLQEIDRMINEKVEGWKVSRMGKAELTILRLAVYEILYDDTVPGSAAINEAVILAKEYGQESSGSFVNAVLAKFV